jgi:hypothetical protein
VTIAKVSGSDSGSVALREMARGVEGVVSLWSWATGGWFAVTVMLNVATFESLVQSFAFQEKLSGPR